MAAAPSVATNASGPALQCAGGALQQRLRPRRIRHTRDRHRPVIVRLRQAEVWSAAHRSTPGRLRRAVRHRASAPCLVRRELSIPKRLHRLSRLFWTARKPPPRQHHVSIRRSRAQSGFAGTLQFSIDEAEVERRVVRDQAARRRQTPENPRPLPQTAMLC